MQTLKYNIRKQALREINDLESKEVLERTIYRELKEDLNYISSFDGKVRLIDVVIENQDIRVIFQVAEQRFTLFDYKILKTLVLDDVNNFIK